MRTHILAALALVLLAPMAGAQGEQDDVLTRPIRSQVGGHVYYAQAVGDFSDYIDHGWGGALHGTFLASESGALGIRFDGSYMNYGRETVRDVCSLPGNCRVTVDVTTTNNVAYAAVGPQLQVPYGPLRPYVAPQVGWTFIWTTSSIEDSDDRDRSPLDTENINDNTFSYGGVAGILLPFTTQNVRTPISLDMGVRYMRNGRVRYLREGDIIDNPTGPPTFDIQRSRADLVTYFVGITVGVR
ncbi:MAG TPA: hypothetical protein VGE02_01815 [Gemmatimonadales bacterium]